MKTMLKSNLVLLLVTLIGTPAVAQEPPREADREAPKEASKDSPKDAWRRPEKEVSFKFKGGTLEAFVERLRELSEVNVVIDEEVRQAAMPPVDLKNVAPDSAFQLVQVIAVNNQGSVQFEKVGGRGSPIYLLKLRPARESDRRGQQEPRVVQVFSLAGLIAEPSAAGAETILTAISRGLEEATEKGQDPASIKFHPESGLLIIKGNAEQTGVVKQVIERLKEAKDTKWSLVRDQEFRKMEDQLRAAQNQLDLMSVRLKESETEASRLRAKFDDLRPQFKDSK